MKIIRRSDTNERARDTIAWPLLSWKVLVVDDEPAVRKMTALNLTGFEFAGRGLSIIEAGSGHEAKGALDAHADIAVALIDVVMESDDAGLCLVEHIRNNLGNRLMRLIIRTGQPGLAPERYVVDTYDIDDYKDKTELTVQKLYTTVRTSLKAYRDLQTIELNRTGLLRILQATPELYNVQFDRLEDYFRELLTQVIRTCNLEQLGMISTVDGLAVTLDGQDIRVHADAGNFGGTVTEGRLKEIADICSGIIHGEDTRDTLRRGAIIVPLQIKDEVLGFIYLESSVELTAENRELIQIMASQCAVALEKFRLHHSLEESYDEAIDMLAHVAEFKDMATGAHVQRTQELTRRVALALGCTREDAQTYAKASRLHDVGKVGIPDAILRKPGRLTPEEFDIIRSHTRIGDAVLQHSSSLGVARTVARSHHERWDGGGYPDGLAGKSIPLAARIVAVVDVFDALVSTRPYKDAWEPAVAIDEIVRGRGTRFDPRVVDALVELYCSGGLDELLARCRKD